jgi:predicted nucleotidyltransferase
VIQPQRLGRSLSVDEFGNVKPDVAVDRIGTVWQPVVALVSDALVNRPGVRLVYLRGSIPRGLAIEGLSDADFFYLSENNFESDDADLERQVESRFPFVKGLELTRLDRDTFDRIRPSGGEVTMDRNDRFTRDLYLCYEQFSQFYPDRSEQMFRALINCLNGGESPLQYGELVTFLAREGARLIAAAAVLSSVPERGIT